MNLTNYSTEKLAADTESPFAGVARRAWLLLRFPEAQRASADQRAYQIYEAEGGYTYHEALAAIAAHERPVAA